MLQRLRRVARHWSLPVVLAVLAAPLVAQTVYHDKSLSFHGSRHIALKAAGYRPVSVDVAGNLTHNRWSAVWEKRAGPLWTAAFGLSFHEMLKWYGERVKFGYRAKWVTSAGSSVRDLVYGCVMVKDGLHSIVNFDMSRESFDFANDVYSAHNSLRHGRYLCSASIHGSSSAPRYAAVWEENPGQKHYGYSASDTRADFVEKFHVFAGQCWARPSVITTNASRQYLSVYTNEDIGIWRAYVDMTKSEYDSLRNTLAPTFRPHQIMVSGLGSAARYDAIFVSGFSTRRISVTGDNVASLRAIDELMIGRVAQTSGFMQQHNVRQAAVAVVKDGCLVFARGYTYANSTWPVTSPTTRFRLASLTKPITSIAVHRMSHDRLNVGLYSKFHTVAPFPNPQDDRFRAIRVHHLIDHLAGWDHWFTLGVTDKLGEAQAAVQSKDLLFKPGTQPAANAQWPYLNGGYMMLGLLLEHQYGTTYLNAIRQQVMQPLGITRTHLIETQSFPWDARCQEANFNSSRSIRVGRSHVGSNRLVNEAYAQSPFRIDATGGLDMSAVDYVRLLAGVFDQNIKSPVLSDSSRRILLARMDKRGRTGGWDSAEDITTSSGSYRRYKKGGLWMSAHTWTVWRSDGIAIAAFSSGPNAPPIDDIDAALNRVRTWPQHDLFPKYGLTSFPKRVRGAILSYGVGCGSVGRRVSHKSSAEPAVGSVQHLSVSHGKPNSIALLSYGNSNRSWRGLRLPVALDRYGAIGCKIYAPPVLRRVVRTDARGRASVRLRHPNRPSLIGSRIYTQFVVVDEKANRLGLTYSNGVETRLGGVR